MQFTNGATREPLFHDFGVAISKSVQSMIILQVLYCEKDEGEHNLFFIRDGIVVIMSLNNRECRTRTNVKTILETVATLHENSWARCKFV